MSLSPDCIPCILKQALYAARIAKINDEKIQIEILKYVIKELNNIDNIETAPELSNKIQDIVKVFSGINDPYAEEKERNLKRASKFVPYLKTYINNSYDKLEQAVRVAILGNIIDLGANPDFKLEDEINRINSNNIVLDDYPLFKEKVEKAKYILYIGDNAEEAIFDKLLIEQLQCKNIIFVVKDSYILNDVTIDFAKKIGLNKIAKVISSGSKVAGTNLKETNKTFNKYFFNAPVIIAKGQGNFETLMNCDREIFYMFKVKCEVIAKRTGYKVGTSVLLKNPK
ncbi:ARMT1-like domain-containing protein [bacterium BMS3Abin03]|nr:ARMT1-like domain-containing protein [bacterium BMS3Abin03]